MYPRGELERLAERKMVLQARIAVRRWESAEAAAELARPLAMVDHGLAVWRRISPLMKVIAVPAGLLLIKAMKWRRASHGGHGGKFGMLLGALPMVMQGVKLFQQMRAARASSNGQHAEPAPAP